MRHLSITTVLAGRAALVAGALTMPVAAWAQGRQDGPRAPWEMMHCWDWGSGWMWLMPFLMMAWFALLVAAIILLVRWLGGGSGGKGVSASSARNILDERYARGEIDREEYVQRKNDIEAT